MYSQLGAWEEGKAPTPSLEDSLRVTSPGRLEEFDNKVARVANQQSALIVAQCHVLQQKVMQALQRESYAVSAPHVLHTQETLGQQHRFAAAKQARAHRGLLLSPKRATLVRSIADMPPAKTRGGPGVSSTCRVCGQPRLNTHGRSGCPTHCCQCKKVKKDCSCQVASQ